MARRCPSTRLTVDGYLVAATRLLEPDAERGTVLAGWDPDETWWLTDRLAEYGWQARPTATAEEVAGP